MKMVNSSEALSVFKGSIYMKTVNLELSKQLYMARYKQETEYIWLRNVHTDKEAYLTHSDNFKGTFESEYEGGVHYEEYAAPTADEILELLPVWLVVEVDGTKYNLLLSIMRHIECWSITYGVERLTSHPITGTREDSLADVAAKMYLYLAENQLLKETEQEK